MSYNTYVGARYVPLFTGEWDSRKDYEPLVVVTNEGNSYTSKTYVPSGTGITNKTYWECTGNYNAQVETYRTETANVMAKYNSLGVANVIDFGADNTGMGDSTQAIKNALASDKTVVYFPSGTYNVFGRISIPENKTLIGYGAKIVYYINTQSLFDITYSNVTIKGLEITRNTSMGRNDKNTSLILVHNTHAVTSQANILISDCYIHNADMYAINLESTNPCNNIKIANCTITDVWVGIKNGGGVTNEHIANCYISDTQAECLTFDSYKGDKGGVGTMDSVVSACTFKNNNGGVGCIGADGSHRIKIIGCNFSNTKTGELSNGITFNRHIDMCSDFIITGCNFHNLNYGIWCRKADETYTKNGISHLTVTGNEFDNNVTDIKIEYLGGYNEFKNDYTKTDRSTIFDIDTTNKYDILSCSKIDVPIKIPVNETMLQNGATLISDTAFNTIVVLNGCFDVTLYIHPNITKKEDGKPNSLETQIKFPFGNTRRKAYTALNTGATTGNPIFAIYNNKLVGLGGEGLGELTTGSRVLIRINGSMQ